MAAQPADLRALGLDSGDQIVADLQCVDDRLTDYLDIRRCDFLDEGQLLMLSEAHRRVRQVLSEITDRSDDNEEPFAC